MTSVYFGSRVLSLTAIIAIFDISDSATGLSEHVAPAHLVPCAVRHRRPGRDSSFGTLFDKNVICHRRRGYGAPVFKLVRQSRLRRGIVILFMEVCTAST